MVKFELIGSRIKANMNGLRIILVLAFISYSQCADEVVFGGKCTSSSQCAAGLACARVGSLQGTCKQDKGQTCSNGLDCVNQLSCIQGKCNCFERHSTYGNSDCTVDKLNGEGDKCKSNSDCKEGLACNSEQNIYNNATNTCQRHRDEFCLYDNECANGLKCIGHWCDCPEDHFFDDVAITCRSKRQFNEPCLVNKNCANNLACDVRVQPTPLSYNRQMTCLKTYGLECTVSLDCVNYLPCNDGFCGCRPNYEYNPLLGDCFPIQRAESLKAKLMKHI